MLHVIFRCDGKNFLKYGFTTDSFKDFSVKDTSEVKIIHTLPQKYLKNNSNNSMLSMLCIQLVELVILRFKV